MRLRPAAASSCALIGLVAVAASAATPPVVISLDPGSVGAAVASLAAGTGLNVVTATPVLLNRPLPRLKLAGTPAAMLKRIAAAAGLQAVRRSKSTWSLVPASSTKAPHPPPLSLRTDTIVVVAKRSLPAIALPAAIDLVPAAALARFGTLADSRALGALVPAVNSTNWGPGREKLFLRGIADSSFVGATPTLTGEYLGELRLTYNAPDPDLRLYDVSGVEILYGPQGTLYGSGAMGGLIRIAPAPPAGDRASGSAWLGGSGVAHGASGYDLGGVLNLPVGERLAVRMLGYAAVDPGYIDNSRTGARNVNRTVTRGGRIALRWRLGGGWTIDASAVAQRIGNRDAPYADAGAAPLTRASSIAEPSHNLFVGGVATLSGRIGAVTVQSSTSLVRQSLGDIFDVPQPSQQPLLFAEVTHTRLVSEELRASATGPLANWVVGAQLLDDRDGSDQRYGFQGYPAREITRHQRTREATLFGELSRAILPLVTATLGVRADAIRFAGRAEDSTSPFNILLTQATQTHAAHESRPIVPSAALSYRLSGAATLFARYAQGYRPPGLAVASTIRRYAGDRIGTAEIGLRSGLAGQGRVDFALGAAISRWRDVQADVLDGFGVPYVENIGDGTVRSLTAEAGARLAPGLRVDVAGFLARSHLRPAAALAAGSAGDTLPNVARDGVSAGATYEHAVLARPVRLGLQLRHVGRSVAAIGTLRPMPQGGYTTLAADARVTIARIDLTLEGSNLADSHAAAFAIGTPFAGVRVQDSPLRPRTVRIGAAVHF